VTTSVEAGVKKVLVEAGKIDVLANIAGIAFGRRNRSFHRGHYEPDQRCTADPASTTETEQRRAYRLRFAGDPQVNATLSNLLTRHRPQNHSFCGLWTSMGDYLFAASRITSATS
jgi:NAD(P)-dependent dehydrogenase (short-subunit alcohol dehydrogenase family)